MDSDCTTHLGDTAQRYTRQAESGGEEDREPHRLRRRAARKGRASLQGTMPCRTPLATMRTGVSCISAKATAICTRPQTRQDPLSWSVGHVARAACVLTMVTKNWTQPQPHTVDALQESALWHDLFD